MQRHLVWATLFLLSAPAVAAEVSTNNCDNAPKESVLKFEPPYDVWFKVECNAIRKAHFISAQAGYEWKEKNTGKSYSFNANGPISPSMDALEQNIYEPHKYHFVKFKSSIMAPRQLSGTNALLPNRKNDYKDIHQLDVLTNTKVVYSFFIFLEENDPKWLVVCVNYSCKQSATIEVFKNNA